MVAMDKKESRGGKESYEAKMKTVLTNLKPKLLLRAGEPWDIRRGFRGDVLMF